MSDSEAGRIGGRRLVVVLYVVVVTLAAGIGLVLGIIAPRGLDPELFGVVQLPPTPLGVAVYGAVTVGALLGVVLAGVAYASRRYAPE